MHLDRKQVGELIPHLLEWLATGSIELKPSVPLTGPIDTSITF